VPRRHRIRTRLSSIERAAAPTGFRSCQPMRDGTSRDTPRSRRPCHTTFDLPGWLVGGGRPWIRLQLGHSLEIRLASRLVRRRHRRLRRRGHDDGRRYGRLAGVQHHLVRPFVLGSDPDGRSVDDARPIRKIRWGLRQRPAGYQQKNSERAADDRKISGNGHSRAPTCRVMNG
jgi:hypothetical protein